jgi:transposase
MSSMLALTDQRRYHLYRKETDMRKGFNLLCGIVTNELGRQVTSGEAFIFINKPRTHLKLLVYESGGFTIFYRRLEKGGFEVPAFDLDAKSLQLSASQLYFILQGVQLQSVTYRKRYQRLLQSSGE